MSDPRTDDPTQSGSDGSALDSADLDRGTGDPNDDRAYLDDLPPAQVDEDAVEENTIDSDETDADA